MRNLTPIKKKKNQQNQPRDNNWQTLAHNKIKEVLGIFLDLLFWLWKETLLAFEKNDTTFVRQWAEATNDSCAQQN